MATTMEEVVIQPFSEDQLNRFRLTHPDKDLRPLLRRLHALSNPPASSANDASTSTAEEDRQREIALIQLELKKWKISVDRMMGNVANLDRQKATYAESTRETVAKTEKLRSALEEQKVLLAKRQRERAWMIQCDEIAKKISAKGKTRAQLDEQIATLQHSVADHRTSHAMYTDTAQQRIDLFSQIGALVEQARAVKLPLEPQALLAESTLEETPEADEMDVDDPPAKASKATIDDIATGKLNVHATPFQPSSASLPNTRATTPQPQVPPSSSSRHALPTRPAARTVSASSTPTAGIPAGVRLPSRPSTLRSVTTPAAAGGSLEEGELGGEEEGEVSETRGNKRAAEDQRSTRSTRRK